MFKDNFKVWVCVAIMMESPCMKTRELVIDSNKP